MPVTPAPTTTTSTVTFLFNRGNFSIGALSIQKGTFLIACCSRRMDRLAVREISYGTIDGRREPKYHAGSRDLGQQLNIKAKTVTVTMRIWNRIRSEHAH